MTNFAPPPTTGPAGAAAAPEGPERNLLRALKGSTLEIHRSLHRLLLKHGARYSLAPRLHDWDFAPFAVTWPFRRELAVPGLLVFAWDTGTGQSLAEYCRYYKHELPRRQPLSLVVTSSPIDPTDLAAAEAVLQSPMAALVVKNDNPNNLQWIGRAPLPPALAQLADEAFRKSLREIDPGEAAEAHHAGKPRDQSYRVEADLIMPRRLQARYTITLLIINIMVYILAVLKTQAATHQFDLNATPVLNQFALSAEAANGEWWRFITCGFMHIGLFHIFMNMWFLFSFGPIAETYLGSNRFLALYMVSLIGSSLVSFAWHYGIAGFGGAAGASGALCGIYYGLFGVVLAVRKVLGKKFVRDIMTRTLRFTLMMLLLGMLANVDNFGHLGGALTGFAVGYAMAVRPDVHPAWLVRSRWLLVALLFVLIGLLDWYAWPHARAAAAGEKLYPAQREEWAEMDQLYHGLKTAVLKLRASPELLGDYDRCEELCQKFVHSPRYEYFRMLNPELAEGSQRLELLLPTVRRQLCAIATERLSKKAQILDAAAGVGGARVPFPSEAPSEETAVAARDFVTKVQVLVHWQGTPLERRQDPALDQSIQALEVAAEQYSSWDQPAQENPVPAPAAGGNSLPVQAVTP